ncbi:MAG: tRNA (adenosine(37)-N6)-threonylcarbamoyltransferase complex dimerization subunit type 1 TsaB, partial [Bacteroidetes bacterium]|nr:tRNA (adenosine(37)-N6)-threonylcarbamoyltransferase complex dimerization subunit type 1 TsaB [Bacteroidota bacterium]
NHADTLIYYIHKFFLSNNISLNKIEIVSLSNGPGSFTGLRISSAIAKGICYSNHSRLIELSTLDIIANKKNTNNKIVPLISSNTKTNEFYYSEYMKEGGQLNRISGYKTDLLENIIKEDSSYLINDNITVSVPEKLRSRLTNVSDLSNIDSMNELTRSSIVRNKFGDYRISEPYYMKDFVPNI